MSTDKDRAVEVGRALMHSGSMSAAAASRIVAPDFGISPETVRRALLDLDYREHRTPNARLKALERRVTELEQLLHELIAPPPNETPTGNTRLTPDEVRMLRNLVAGGESIANAARQMGIGYGTARLAVKRETYRSVE